MSAPTNPVTAAREVTARGSYRKVDGVRLDTFTASAIVAVADALSAENRRTLEAMSVTRAAAVCLKLAAKS
jgi:hypothetical protein